MKNDLGCGWLIALGMIIFGVCVWADRAYPATSDRVDVALVLAVDHSSSVLPLEWRLQMEGYASALESEAVQASIVGGYHGSIAVTMFRWSDDYSQHVMIPWRKVDSAAGIAQLAADIRALADLPSLSGTCVTGALVYSQLLLADLPFKAERHVVDVSGDEGGLCVHHPARPDSVRDAMVYQGVTINGLPIIADSGVPEASGYYNPNNELERFYRDHVIGGPGSFLVIADGYAAFGQAVHRKLLQEIASLSPIKGARP